jgi:UDP-N-acetylglucosamine 2-epimerase (non-hydrolysing)
MKVLTIVGTRPQFVKVAPVSRVLRQEHREVLVHTGQHYNDNMSRVFFEDLAIPPPDYNLEVGSSSHAVQTGKMMGGIEDILVREKPDCVLVYGDTNSTLAAALATVKLQLPLVHVEAGLRSFNREMPEEINRVITDHVSTVLFAPTQTAVYNLEREGITQNVVLSGDVMCDAVRQHQKVAREKSGILERLKLKPGEYLLATIHRPGNTDDRRNMENIIGAFIKSDQRIVFPMHPRTQRFLLEYGLKDQVAKAGKMTIINPVGYLDMLMLEMNSRKILTDSGGIQKEAYLLKVPCVTLRPETEWVETVNEGWNVLVDADPEKILTAILSFTPQREPAELFGDGHAAVRIVRYLQEWLEKDRTLHI